LEWLEIDQDNMHMKFSALNVDFSNSNLGSKRPAHVGSKRGTPLKSGYYLLLACLAWK